SRPDPNLQYSQPAPGTVPQYQTSQHAQYQGGGGGVVPPSPYPSPNPQMQSYAPQMMHQQTVSYNQSAQQAPPNQCPPPSNGHPAPPHHFPPPNNGYQAAPINGYSAPSTGGFPVPPVGQQPPPSGYPPQATPGYAPPVQQHQQPQPTHGYVPPPQKPPHPTPGYPPQQQPSHPTSGYAPQPHQPPHPSPGYAPQPHQPPHTGYAPQPLQPPIPTPAFAPQSPHPLHPTVYAPQQPLHPPADYAPPPQQPHPAASYAVQQPMQPSPPPAVYAPQQQQPHAPGGYAPPHPQPPPPAQFTQQQPQSVGGYASSQQQPNPSPPTAGHAPQQRIQHPQPPIPASGYVPKNKQQHDQPPRAAPQQQLPRSAPVQKRSVPLAPPSHHTQPQSQYGGDARRRTPPQMNAPPPRHEQSMHQSQYGYEEERSRRTNDASLPSLRPMPSHYYKDIGQEEEESAPRDSRLLSQQRQQRTRPEPVHSRREKETYGQNRPVDPPRNGRGREGHAVLSPEGQQGRYRSVRHEDPSMRARIEYENNLAYQMRDQMHIRDHSPDYWELADSDKRGTKEWLRKMIVTVLNSFSTVLEKEKNGKMVTVEHLSRLLRSFDAGKVSAEKGVHFMDTVDILGYKEDISWLDFLREMRDE
ncbi:hypothetical protein PMAYCL1PPCAC_02218, partial [Pristionchus mayeri]